MKILEMVEDLALFINISIFPGADLFCELKASESPDKNV